MNYYDKLTALFSDHAFVDSIKDFDNIDDIYNVVSTKIADVKKSDLESYLTTVAEYVSVGEISEKELDNVSGGVGFLAIVGGVAAVVGLLNGCYTAGSNLGKLIANIKNRKNN